MKHSRDVTRTVTELAGITCDRCNRLVDADDTYERQEMLSLVWTGGFLAVMGDMVTWEIDLCQHCVQAVLGPWARTVTEMYPESSDDVEDEDEQP